MGLRQAIGEKPKVTAIATGVILVAALSAIAFQISGNAASGAAGRSYYSVDDGQTFFVDDQAKTSPFDYGGKPAYLAHVYECNGKKVVGYLSRYTEQALAAMRTAAEAKRAGRPVPNPMEMSKIGFSGIELKKPGAKAWINSSADPRKVDAIRVFKCPDGSTPSEVFP